MQYLTNSVLLFRYMYVIKIVFGILHEVILIRSMYVHHTPRGRVPKHREQLIKTTLCHR